jgi:hypothetical protein
VVHVAEALSLVRAEPLFVVHMEGVQWLAGGEPLSAGPIEALSLVAAITEASGTALDDAIGADAGGHMA